MTVKELKKTINEHETMHIYLDDMAVKVPLGSLSDDLIVEVDRDWYGFGVAMLSDKNTYESIKDVFDGSSLVSKDAYRRRSIYAEELRKAIDKSPTMDIKSFQYMMDRLPL